MVRGGLDLPNLLSALGIRSMKYRNVEGERDDGAGEQERLDSDRTK